jgi:hypothetical protein
LLLQLAAFESVSDALSDAANTWQKAVRSCIRLIDVQAAEWGSWVTDVWLCSQFWRPVIYLLFEWLLEVGDDRRRIIKSFGKISFLLSSFSSGLGRRKEFPLKIINHFLVSLSFFNVRLWRVGSGGYDRGQWVVFDEWNFLDCFKAWLEVVIYTVVSIGLLGDLLRLHSRQTLISQVNPVFNLDNLASQLNGWLALVHFAFLWPVNLEELVLMDFQDLTALWADLHCEPVWLIVYRAVLSEGVSPPDLVKN